MADLAPYPDCDDILSLVLGDLGFTIVIRKTPANLQDVLPLCRIRRIGGRSSLITDRPRVDIDMFAATYVQARDFAKAIEQRILNFPQSTAVGTIDWADTEVGPRDVPYSDQEITLFAATYRLSLRRS